MGGTLDGWRIEHTLDEFLRRTNTTVYFGGTEQTRSGFMYTNGSRLWQVRNGASTIVYDFQGATPLVTRIEHQYGSATPLVFHRGLDVLDRVSWVASSNAAHGVMQSFSYGYNLAHQRTARTNVDQSRWNFGYDSLGQVTSGKRSWADGKLVAGQQYEYLFDDIGNRKHAGAGGNEWGTGLRYGHYTANSLNQYLSRTVPGYVEVQGSATNTATVTVNNQPTYRKGEYFRAEMPATNSAGPQFPEFNVLAVLSDGANGDILTNISGHIYVPQTPETFLHDQDGNLVRDGRWTNQWNAINRLVQQTTIPSVPEDAECRLVYEYDARGRRIRKTVYNRASGGACILDEKYLWDNWNIIARINGTNNALIQFYVWGLDLSGSREGAGGVGGLLAIHDTTRGSFFPGYDANGNVTLLVNASDSSVAAEYEYGPFGEVLRATGPMAKANPFRFSTRYQDEETGLLYYGFRYYNPSAGRWLSRDPIGERGGPNRYGFALNNAVSHWDLLGLLVEMPPTLPEPPPTIPPEPMPVPRVSPPSIPRVPPAGPPPVAACIAAAVVGWEIGTAIDEAQDHLVTDYWGEKLGDCIDRCRRVKCSYRHPTWMKCRKDATSSPRAATERDAPSVQGWSGPYVTAVHSGGDAKKCPGGAPGSRHYVQIRYIRHNETGFQYYDMQLSVNCCKCCNTFTEGTSCEVVHPKRGSGETPYPDPINW